jgi:hypothetical protein
MRHRQLSATTLALVATLFATAAPAQAPSAAPAAQGKHGPGADHPGKSGERKGPPAAAAASAAAPGKDHGKADDKHGKADGEHGKADDKHGKADGEHGKADHKHGGGHGAHGMHQLIQDLKHGKLKKGDVKERLSALQERRDDRIKEHRHALKARFGATLAMPSARAELEHHARRMAFLNRALLLCETEVTKDKDKLKARVEKLMTKENERHERAMERLKSTPTTPAASAGAASAAPAPVAAPGASADKAGAP